MIAYQTPETFDIDSLTIAYAVDDTSPYGTERHGAAADVKNALRWTAILISLGPLAEANRIEACQRIEAATAAYAKARQS